MSWDQLAEPGLTGGPSPAESRRFGVEVHRLTVGPGDLDVVGLRAAVEDSDADVLVVRYDVVRQEVAAALAASSRAVLPAGALTYWETQVRDLPVGEPPRTVVVGAAALPDAVADAAVRAVVRASFTGYGNHYTADPLLDRRLALDGYEEWALRSLARADHEVLVQLDGDRAVGVATVERAGTCAEVLLAGLVPAAQGRRLYGELLAAVERAALADGLDRLVISTQVQNVRVQRAWARHGLRPFAAVETVHLVRPEALRAVLGG
ncbi:MAG TPA: GNAT family N-acetyltransferase [Cellulomonas sp.]